MRIIVIVLLLMSSLANGQVRHMIQNFNTVNELRNYNKPARDGDKVYIGETKGIYNFFAGKTDVDDGKIVINQSFVSGRWIIAGLDSSHVYKTEPYLSNGDTVGITIKSLSEVSSYVFCQTPIDTIQNVTLTYTQVEGIEDEPKVGFHTTAPEYLLDMANVDGLLIPKGTTAQRPNSPQIGLIRFNTTNVLFEGYNGLGWVILGDPTIAYSQVIGTSVAYSTPIQSNGSTSTYGVNVGGLDGIRLPFGSTLERPILESAGIVRYNLSTDRFEYYNGTTWIPINQFTAYLDQVNGNTTNTIGLAIGKSNADYALDIFGKTAIRISRGTTLERPINLESGLLRFNTTTSKLEGYNGNTWVCF